ncbi:hypothetical protein PQ796_15655 [Priestia megaterium]|nr:hypothetical protein [Priestia megaterium]MDH2451968.1 hypothetical protein [Priestia megaterium]MDL5151425.1 hypothetical protein [Priestia megaterium]MED3870248.1 hypothetical protein [Priestia megaterium]
MHLSKQMIQLIEYRAMCDQQSFDLANRYLSTLANQSFKRSRKNHN